MPRVRPLSSTTGKASRQRAARQGKPAFDLSLARRLWQDRSGNVLPIVAAAMLPLLALVGSSIDIGRGYLAQSRLQGACDAGSLAMRKQLGNGGVTNPTTIAAADLRGQQFFNRNFPDGAYGSVSRRFTLAVGTDGSVQGTANISLPMAIMQIFGKGNMPIAAKCSAQLNFPNTDVMLVLDNTGSMADTNPGDTQNKITILRSVVAAFYNQLEAAKPAGTRVRYGFVPYSQTVNVGELLKSDWVVDDWLYHGRSSQVIASPLPPFFTWVWRYGPTVVNVRSFKGATGNDPLQRGSILVPMAGTPDTPAPLTVNFHGCMEEPDTYEITDWNNVDFSRARDLDIDGIPVPGNPATQWRPILRAISYATTLDTAGVGSWVTGFVNTPADLLNVGAVNGSDCPTQAQKLKEMTPAEMTAYLATLRTNGNTYHDIGMIWGGRLLSPTGLFAAENADIPGSPTRRNLIFLTDGVTATTDYNYASYGIEPLDRRRWSLASGQPLSTVIENRFTVVCNEVKRRNINVWVISFGITLNPVLANCAGPGRSFEAANASQLSAAFTTIAGRLGQLRLNN